MSRNKVTASYSKSMFKIEQKCTKCKDNLYETKLNNRIFCRTCGEYKDRRK